MLPSNSQNPLNLVMDFGKYKGRTIARIAEQDPRYLMWIGSLPAVRRRSLLWSSVRGHLLKILQDELTRERFGDLA